MHEDIRAAVEAALLTGTSGKDVAKRFKDADGRPLFSTSGVYRHRADCMEMRGWFDSAMRLRLQKRKMSAAGPQKQGRIITALPEILPDGSRPEFPYIDARTGEPFDITQRTRDDVVLKIVFEPLPDKLKNPRPLLAPTAESVKAAETITVENTSTPVETP